jgi:AraC-like DNA-binding protein
MHQSLLFSQADGSLINPFQHSMGFPSLHGLDSHAFEAPLPLSAVHDDPDLPSASSGLFSMSWPCLQLVALAGAPTRAMLGARSWLSFVYVVAGDISYAQQNTLLHGSAGDCFFVPQGEAVWKSSSYSVVCLSIAPEQVLASLKSLRPADTELNSTYGWDLTRPKCMKASDGTMEASMLQTLHHLLCITSELAINHPKLQAHLGVTNQLSLLLALMACPDLNEALASESMDIIRGGMDEAINDLTNYMTSHLSEPLNLQILEQYSHYSRRSLQYAFRQRFGCTITQWIRAKRLDLAFEKLKMGKKQDSVSSIANACGYRSPNLFSLEFQSRFHVKPSFVLREHQGGERKG